MAHEDIPPAAWHTPARRRRWLTRLAHDAGVGTFYHSQEAAPGRRRREVSEGSVIAVLAAMGLPAATEAQARASLAQRRAAAGAQEVPVVTVVRQGQGPGQGQGLAVRLPAGGATAGSPPALEVTLEDGQVRTLPVLAPTGWAGLWHRVAGGRRGRVALPDDLPLGYHTIRLRGGTGEPGHLIVTPDRCVPVTGSGEPGRLGLMAQLYSVRSRRSQGVGDFTDLGQLAEWAAQQGGCDFLLVNPLCAGVPVQPYEDSPYLPGTRRFLDPLTLDAEAVLAAAQPGRRPRREPATLPDGTVVPPGGWDTRASLLDRERAMQVKDATLRQAHRLWQEAAPADQRAAFAAYQQAAGAGLRNHASYLALAAHHGPDWRAWPAELRDPAQLPEAVRVTIAPAVEYHSWLQWQCRVQLAAAQSRARAAGMTLGLLNDLPVGVHRHGSETWAGQDLFALGMSVGCPPDAYNQLGQDWDQPPWRPDALRRSGYRPFRDVLAAMLADGGGVRIDHILGLFRLWWVPAGRRPLDGAYVAQDHEALVGIAVLEAHRAGAVLIGEDLGTYERWVRGYLDERGVLGTDVVWFTAPVGDRLPGPQTWRSGTLATVTTHDAAPTAGYLAGEHVRVRSVLGLLTETFEDAWAAHVATVERWRRAFTAWGYLDATAPPAADPAAALLLAAHRYLGATPAALVCVTLADLTGDPRLQNQPGTDAEYPNWRVPLSDGQGRPVWVDDLPQRDAPALPAWRLALPVLDAARPLGAPAPR